MFGFMSVLLVAPLEATKFPTWPSNTCVANITVTQIVVANCTTYAYACVTDGLANKNTPCNIPDYYQDCVDTCEGPCDYNPDVPYAVYTETWTRNGFRQEQVGW